ncbi:MAG: class I SAM-dependent methyltransferase [Erysipelotrichia bacterium]|nr:class I SAM-dependent methyltransferase [Erysipelotrichia bacterium]
MFWDNIAWIYDVFANIINRKANHALCIAVEGLISSNDDVLECACGTGLLTGVIAPRCKSLIATDFSAKMLKRTEKKYGKYKNVRYEQANILRLPYPNEHFDTIVAANVIHLLDEPYQALHELERVCKPGGKIIIPTYMNQTDKGKTNGVSSTIGRMGVDFKRKFTLDTYKQFFDDVGYMNVEYILCKGRIPCAVAILTRREKARNL